MKQEYSWLLVISIIFLALVLIKYSTQFSVIDNTLIYGDELNYSGIPLIVQSSKEFSVSEKVYNQDNYYFQRTVYDNKLNNFGITVTKTREANTVGRYADSEFRTVIYTKNNIIDSKTLNKIRFKFSISDSASFTGCVSTQAGHCVENYEAVTNKIYLINDNESIILFSDNLLNGDKAGEITLIKNFDSFVLDVNSVKTLINVNGSYKLLLETTAGSSPDENGLNYVHSNNFYISDLEIITGGTSTINNTFNYYNTIRITNTSIVYINQTYYYNQTINNTLNQSTQTIITPEIPEETFLQKYGLILLTWVAIFGIIIWILYNKKK